jgi:hypothetical protein
MNKPNPERDLVEQALAAVTPHGLRSHVVEAEGLIDPRRPDAIIEIGRDDDMVRHMVRYVVEVKHRVTAANVGPIVHNLRSRPDTPLLVTTYVSPPVATRLHDQGVQFIDTAGNASLSNRVFMVWVKGERPAGNLVDLPVSPDGGRACQPRGLQVVFTLLCDPERINKPLRELARMSGVALGTVASVIGDLEQEGFVRKSSGAQGARRMFEFKDLLRKWTDAYARSLRPRTLLARLYAPNTAEWDKWNLGSEAMWGGEPAAALLTRHLKPGALTTYAAKVPAPLIARQRLLKAAEPGHTTPVEFRRRFWYFEIVAAPAPLFATVPPLLVYADLLAVGDARCLETATLIYEDQLARFIEP